MSAKRPHVILNVAMTADGKTDTVARRGAAISSPRDLERVDRLRAASDAIMVGGRTLLGDDPRLTVKSAALRAERRARGLDENPIKVGVITNASLRLDSRFITGGAARVMLFTTRRTSAEQITRLRARGAQVIVMGEQRVDLVAALGYLKDSGIHHLLVEGGGTLNAELLQQGLIDELYLYSAPLIFAGADAPSFADGTGLSRDAAIHLQLDAVEHDEDGGILIHYRIPKL
ncbi:MAG: 2,5-diamino-6-(ribosylamino)-4(3H)-pyrimidinone 5'-phosphate reductase [Chloroflexi bacterium]|nr:2,5-diamino-6-(ribosylamino)-4(3H)-pyrimidinone 5'-phosphate reductase [Chloroflexota bacterium]